jgi:hypothetical protein
MAGSRFTGARHPERVSGFGLCGGATTLYDLVLNPGGITSL